MADAEHVCVYCHSRFIENNGLDDIGWFAAYAGQFYQFFKGIGYLTVEFFHQHLCHAYKSVNVKNTLHKIKAVYPDLEVVVGNIATAEAAEFLISNAWQYKSYPKPYNLSESFFYRHDLSILRQKPLKHT